MYVQVIVILVAQILAWCSGTRSLVFLSVETTRFNGIVDRLYILLSHIGVRAITLCGVIITGPLKWRVDQSRPPSTRLGMRD